MQALFLFVDCRVIEPLKLIDDACFHLWFQRSVLSLCLSGVPLKNTDIVKINFCF
jgi:hypothetical protein